jgi:hypothetical protein
LPTDVLTTSLGSKIEKIALFEESRIEKSLPSVEAKPNTAFCVPVPISKLCVLSTRKLFLIIILLDSSTSITSVLNPSVIRSLV